MQRAGRRVRTRPAGSDVWARWPGGGGSRRRPRARRRAARRRMVRREDERDERGRDAAQRDRRGEGHAQAGEDKDHTESAGTGIGGGRVDAPSGRRGSRHSGQLLWWLVVRCSTVPGIAALLIGADPTDRSGLARSDVGESTPDARRRIKSLRIENAGRRAPGSRPARWSQRAGQNSWRSNTSFAPPRRTIIEIAQPIGVRRDAGWPLATCNAHDPIDVGERSLTIGRSPPRTCGRNITAKAMPATPTVDLTPAPRATVSGCRRQAGPRRARRTCRRHPDPAARRTRPSPGRSRRASAG